MVFSLRFIFALTASAAMVASGTNATNSSNSTNSTNSTNATANRICNTAEVEAMGELIGNMSSSCQTGWQGAINSEQMTTLNSRTTAYGFCVCYNEVYPNASNLTCELPNMTNQRTTIAADAAWCMANYAPTPAPIAWYGVDAPDIITQQITVTLDYASVGLIPANFGTAMCEAYSNILNLPSSQYCSISFAAGEEENVRRLSASPRRLAVFVITFTITIPASVTTISVSSVTHAMNNLQPATIITYANARLEQLGLPVISQVTVGVVTQVQSAQRTPSPTPAPTGETCEAITCPSLWVSNPVNYRTSYPSATSAQYFCCLQAVDTNGNGVIDLAEYAAIVIATVPDYRSSTCTWTRGNNNDGNLTRSIRASGTTRSECAALVDTECSNCTVANHGGAGGECDGQFGTPNMTVDNSSSTYSCDMTTATWDHRFCVTYACPTDYHMNVEALMTSPTSRDICCQAHGPGWITNGAVKFSVPAKSLFAIIGGYIAMFFV